MQRARRDKTDVKFNAKQKICARQLAVYEQVLQVNYVILGVTPNMDLTAYLLKLFWDRFRNLF